MNETVTVRQRKQSFSLKHSDDKLVALSAYSNNSLIYVSFMHFEPL